jgi:hypothetical protein
VRCSPQAPRVKKRRILEVCDGTKLGAFEGGALSANEGDTLGACGGANVYPAVWDSLCWELARAPRSVPFAENINQSLPAVAWACVPP